MQGHVGGADCAAIVGVRAAIEKNTIGDRLAPRTCLCSVFQCPMESASLITRPEQVLHDKKKKNVGANMNLMFVLFMNFYS